MSIPPPASRVHKSEGLFHMEHSVSAHVRAPVERIWALLTDAPGFARWNSTVSRIEGQIAAGSKITVHVPGQKRAFALTVSEVEANKRMVWSSGTAAVFKGVRTFFLVPLSDGSTEFSMVEELSGLMLPLIKGSLPDFSAMFERYAADLQRAAEQR